MEEVEAVAVAVLVQISMGDHLFVEVRETVADAEHAEDYERDVSLDWLVAAVEEEAAQSSVLRGRNLKSVKKRRELGAAVQVEEPVEYHWHCLPRLWLGDY